MTVIRVVVAEVVKMMEHNDGDCCGSLPERETSVSSLITFPQTLNILLCANPKSHFLFLMGKTISDICPKRHGIAENSFVCFLCFVCVSHCHCD